MKLKYIVFYFIVAWIIVIFASLIIENYCISLAAKNVNDTVALAAEMAINTVQSSDEFFKGSGVSLNDGNGRQNDAIGAYMIYTPFKTGGVTKGYRRQNLYTKVAEDVWNVDLSNAVIYSGNNTNAMASSDNTGTEYVYAYMYGIGNGIGGDFSKSEFSEYLSRVGNINNDLTHIPLSQIMYLTGSRGVYNLEYGVIPTTLRMGADMIQANEFFSTSFSTISVAAINSYSKILKTGEISLNALYNNSLNADELFVKYDTLKPNSIILRDNSEYKRIADANGFTSYRKSGSVLTNDTYYITPLSLGLTYLDNDLLSYCFINNMDLLMRSKYISNITKISDDVITSMRFGEETGDGLNLGIGFNQYLTNSNIKEYNIISNGNFGFVKGKNDSNGDFEPTFDGSTTSTKVTYMIIDMFNNTGDAETRAATEDILKQVFSAYKGSESSVGAYLQSICTDRDLVTGEALQHKYIVVAKCDFYADIIVPYTTPLFREFAYKYTSYYTENTDDDRINGEEQTDADGNKTIVLADNNFLNLAYGEEGEKETNKKVSEVTGNTMYHYTTYFAVAP